MCSSRDTLIMLGSLLVSSFLIAPVNSFAQKRGEPSTAARREAIFSRESDIQYRELNLRLLREPGKAKYPELSAEDRKLLVSQIFEDFQRIQIINRELTQASSNLNPTTYKHMSTLAEEMSKRAKRLKENLGIPGIAHEKKDSEKAPEIDSTQLKTSLQTLSGSVKSFVTNPLFQDPRVTDVQHLESLRRDITNVIDLSRAVKKAVARLARA